MKNLLFYFAAIITVGCANGKNAEIQKLESENRRLKAENEAIANGNEGSYSARTQNYPQSSQTTTHLAIEMPDKYIVVIVHSMDDVPVPDEDGTYRNKFKQVDRDYVTNVLEIPSFNSEKERKLIDAVEQAHRSYKVNVPEIKGTVCKQFNTYSEASDFRRSLGNYGDLSFFCSVCK